jgi:hypothetical protein
MTIVDNGPPLLDAPNIVIVFWGSSWVNGADAANVGSILGAVHQVIDGPYFEGLNQLAYHYLRRPRLSTYIDFNTRSEPSTVCTTHPNFCYLGDIWPMLKSEISLGALPGSTASLTATTTGSVAYLVFTPSNMGVWCSGKPAGGCHDQGTSSTGNALYFSWMSDKFAVAHELVEMMTHPNTHKPNGVFATNPTIGTGHYEIEDACCDTQIGAPKPEGNHTSLGLYWSPGTGRCIAPYAWGDIAQLNSPSDWSWSFHKPVQLATAGTWGLAVQDAAAPFHVWVRPFGGAWQDTGLPGGAGTGVAQLAITNEAVYAIRHDLAAVFRWVSGQWVNIGGNPSNIFAGDFGALFGTDPVFNALWTWTPSGGWRSIGPGAATSYAVSTQYIFRLNWDGLTWVTDPLSAINGSTNWTLTTAPAAYAMYGGAPGVGLFETNGGNAYFVSSPTGTFPLGATGDVLAVADNGFNGNLYRLAAQRGGVFQVNSMFQSNPGWSSAWPHSTANLVTGGKALYITHPAVCSADDVVGGSPSNCTVP